MKDFAHVEFPVLRARAAKNENFRCGLFDSFRRAWRERPLWQGRGQFGLAYPAS